jgi:TolB-like protein/Tfp pilus assembly protein PilF
MEAGDRGGWERTKGLFVQALESAPERREAIVSAACGGDSALRAELWSLLAADAEAGEFLEQPAVSRLAQRADEGRLRRLAPWDRLDRYEVVSFLGAGAVSEVYRARDSRLGRTVALKLLTDPTAHDAGAWLLREAQHASTLNHPHVCTVHEVDEVDGRPFIVLEYIEGVTLHAAMRQGPLPLGTIVRWGAEIADALDHAHRRGVVHRDLKSSNVLVTPEQHVKVLDFGLARRLETDAGSNAATSVLADASVAGTLTHIAPEVLGGGPADARVDIWALGVMLYELASGVVPFIGATTFATATAILEDTPEPLPGSVPPAFRQIIERCLSKNPASRHASASRVREALHSLAQHVASTSRPSRPTRRAAVAAVLTVLLAAAGYLGSTALGVVRGADPEAVPLLAVLPILDPSGDGSQRFLADGMTEAIVAELGRIDAIRVIAPGSTRPFGGQSDAVRAVARDTGAAQVLTGAVTRNGDRIRLAVRLTEVSSGRVVWSAEYDRHARELQALHGVVALEVASAIEIELHEDDEDRLTRIRAVDPDVYEAYLKGRYYWNQRTTESLRTAMAHYEAAIRLDPSYAPAYAALADCYNQLGTQMVGGGSPREWRPKATEAAIRALQIDPALAEAHATLGYVRHYEWEWEAAEQSFRRAIALNPSYPLARIWYANLLSARSRVDEAMAEVTAAAELDPLSPLIATNVGWVLINARRYDEAIATLTPIVARDPGYVQAHSRLAGAYSFSGRHAEAVAQAQTAGRLTGGSASPGELAQALALAGRREEAERLWIGCWTSAADACRPARSRTSAPPSDAPTRPAVAGAVARRACDNNAYWPSTVCDSLRSDPRFQALLAHRTAMTDTAASSTHIRPCWRSGARAIAVRSTASSARMRGTAEGRGAPAAPRAARSGTGADRSSTPSSCNWSTSGATWENRRRSTPSPHA